ncbi:MAG: hypothetical protein KDA69_12380, partial [Planctomycetaceae bacterium]|nr:hypothetical protein [Planctomycetaceae bacterium]
KEVWPAFFKQHRPHPGIVSDLVLTLSKAKEHEHVISCIQSALINGQAQPWMYELLAVAMEQAGRPREDIERVVLSLSDFGNVDYGSVMYSGAYLANFKRHAAALHMYRQGAQMFPERPEPYLLGLKQAQLLKTPEDIAWAGCGILEHYWGNDYEQQHRAALIAVTEAQRKLRQSGNVEQSGEIDKLLIQARTRDMRIRVEWSGEADLDLAVTEPPGTICSFETPETMGGGLHTHDGYGPTPESSYEEYFCPRGYAGDYQLHIVSQGGRIVSNRAVVTVSMAVGTPQEKTERHTVKLDEGEATITVTLPQGRRTQPRRILSLHRGDIAQLEAIVNRTVRSTNNSADVQRVAAEFTESRLNTAMQGRGGAFGFAPVVRVLNEGTSVRAGVVVSPDRRYVRLSINPTFTAIPEVHTFSFIGGGSSAASGAVGNQ